MDEVRLRREIESLDTRLKILEEFARRRGPKDNLWFYQDNVAAAQTAVALANGFGAVIEYAPMPRSGFIVGLGVYSNEARTAGTLDIKPRINGTALSFSVQLNGTDTTKKILRIPATLPSYFAEGARIGAEITTSAGWTPVTADIMAVVFVEFPMED